MGYYIFNDYEKACWGGEGILLKLFTGCQAHYWSRGESPVVCSDVSSRNWRKQRHHSGVSVCSGCHSTLTARKTYRPMWKMPVWESFFCASTLFMCVCTLMGSNPQYPWEWDFGRRDRHLRRCGEAPGYWVESWREVAASSSALAVYGWAQGRLLKHWLIFTYLKCFFFFQLFVF